METKFTYILDHRKKIKKGKLIYIWAHNCTFIYRSVALPKIPCTYWNKNGHSINKVMLSKSRLYRGRLDPSICMSVTRCTFSHLMIFNNFGSLKNCHSLKNWHKILKPIFNVRFWNKFDNTREYIYKH